MFRTSLKNGCYNDNFYVQTLVRLLILEITFFLWIFVTSVCLLTEVQLQWATLVLGWVTAVGHYSFL